MDPKLSAAVRSNNLFQLESLLWNPNVDVTSVSAGKNNVLHIAASFGRKEIMEKIVSHVSKPTLNSLLLQSNSRGNSPLHCATLASDSRFVDLIIPLMMEHVGIEQKNKQGDTALHLAAAGDSDEDLKIVKRLLEESARLGGEANSKGEHPVYIAAERGSLHIMKYLVDHSLDFPTIGPLGKTALHAAVARSEPGFFNHLLAKREALKTQQDDEGSTPLHYVASCGDLWMTELLLDGANICDKKNRYPIHIAAVEGHVGVIRLILRTNPDACEVVDKSGRNFLHVAVKHERIEVVKYVIEEGMLLQYLLTNQQDNDGNTPLHLAVRNHHLGIVRLLLKVKKLHKLVRNSWGMTPLDLATFDIKSHSKLRTLAMVKELLDSGAEFSARRLDRVEEPAMSSNARQGPMQSEIRNSSNDNLIVVSVLIFTLSFAAGFTLPGGYMSDSAGADEGTAVLADRVVFKMFVLSNTMALVTSLIATYCLIQDRFLEKYQHVQNVKLSLRFSIIMIMIAFGTGTYAVISPDSKWLAVIALCMSIVVPTILIQSMSFTMKQWAVLKVLRATDDDVWMRGFKWSGSEMIDFVYPNTVHWFSQASSIEKFVLRHVAWLLPHPATIVGVERNKDPRDKDLN